MGVHARIVLHAESEASARDAAAAAFDRLAQLDAMMSDYRADSELNRLGRSGINQPVSLSDDLFPVLAVAREIAVATDGAFDPTIGPLVRLWREARTSRTLPDPNAIIDARSRVGIIHLDLNAVDRTATLRREGMQLDLGGIAKGYAAQAAVDLLRAGGHARCLVALAGDIVAGDPPPGASGWVVAIESSLPVHAPGHRLLLANAAASTSGTSMQFIEIDGVRYAHLIDPRTGLGLTKSVAVTVIAPRGEYADALASAACILGPHGFQEALMGMDNVAAIFHDSSERTILDPANVVRWTSDDQPSM